MRFQPLNTLDKDSYISPGWSHEELDLVAQARRVIGFGGAFPPYEGLTKKFLDARNFEEAFGLWPREQARATPTCRPAAYVITDTQIQSAKESNGGVRELTLGDPDALAGKYLLLVSHAGKVKKLSLLNIYNRASKRSDLGVDEGDTIAAALDIERTDSVFFVSKRGKIALFKGETIRPRSLHRTFTYRFLLTEGDSVVFGGVAHEGQTFVAVTENGYVGSRAIGELYVYNSTGTGEGMFPHSAGLVVSGATSSGLGLSVSITMNTGRSERISLSGFGITQAPTRLINVGLGERIVSAKFEHDESQAAYLSQMGRDHQWPSTKLHSERA
jgi:DNA gyrase/topoisomerase IV subunit A